MASFEAIEVLLQLLPKGTNPYPYILQAVQHEVYPTAKNSFFIQLYIIAAMDLLVVLLCLLSLGAHYYKGTFWIFRVKSSTNGNFIISNGVLGWQIPGAVFYIGAIVYIAKSIQHLEGNYVPGLATLSFLVWIPAFFAGWCVLINTAAGYLLKLNNSESIFLSGLFFNTSAIGIPIVNILTLIPFGILTQLRANASEKAFENFENFLLNASTNFDAKTFSLADVLLLLPPGKLLKDASTIFFQSVTVVGSLLTAWALMLLLLGLVFSTLQLRSLSRDIARAESYGANGLSERSGSSWGQKGASIRSTYYLLITIISTFSLMTLNFAASSLFIAMAPALALGNPVAIEAYTLTVLYSFAIPGLLIMLVVCKQSFQGVFVSKSTSSQVIAVKSPQTATHATFPWMTYDEAVEKMHNDLELRSKFMATRTLGLESDEKGGLNLELVVLGEKRVMFEH